MKKVDKYHCEDGSVDVELFKILCRPILLFMKNTRMQGITFSMKDDYSFEVDADYRKPIPLNIKIDLLEGEK